MNKFMEMVQNDHKAIFLNPAELGEMHDLNGIECLCSVQSLTDKEMLVNHTNGMEGIVGKTINVFCTLADLGELPAQGRVFKVDGDIFYVLDIVNNMGMLKITLGTNLP